MDNVTEGPSGATRHRAGPAGGIPARARTVWTADLALVGGLWLWATAAAALCQFVVYRRVHGEWEVAGAQAGCYAVIVAPALAWCARQRRTARTRRKIWAALLGAALLAVAVIYLAARHGPIALALAGAATAGVGEEIVFRGAIWRLLQEAGLRRTGVVVIDTGLFTAMHVPLWIATHQLSVTSVVSVAVMGTLFCLARAVSGGLALPILLHIALDTVGSG